MGTLPHKGLVCLPPNKAKHDPARHHTADPNNRLESFSFFLLNSIHSALKGSPRLFISTTFAGNDISRTCGQNQ